MPLNVVQHACPLELLRAHHGKHRSASFAVVAAVGLLGHALILRLRSLMCPPCRLPPLRPQIVKKKVQVGDDARGRFSQAAKEYVR